MASICVFFMFGLLVLPFATAQNIRIITEGLRKEEGGTVFVCLFQSEKGFPDDATSAYRILQIKATEPLIMPDIPPGQYAIVLLHDLDGNGKMTYSFLGLPKDGFSSSPAGGSSFSKPVFGKCKFRHGSGETLLRMKIHYIL